VVAGSAEYWRLVKLNRLTAGDFANAKRRLVALAGELNAENFWRELQIEQQMKPSSSMQSMGFV
jgi:hypothetical protein